ncbi:unnamed protein product [Absidia cylindrospora]
MLPPVKHSTLAHCPLETLRIELRPFDDNFDDDDDGEIMSEIWTGPAANTPALVDQQQQYHYLTCLTLYYPNRDMLQRLSATGNYFYLHHPHRTDTPFLIELSLRDLRMIDSSDVIDLFQDLPYGDHLQRLRVESCGSSFNDTFLDTIATYFPNLITLEFCYNIHFTHQALRRLIRRAPRLTRVTLIEGGFKKEHFPEAGQHCVRNIINQLRVHQLDQQAINAIRQLADVD